MQHECAHLRKVELEHVCTIKKEHSGVTPNDGSASAAATPDQMRTLQLEEREAVGALVSFYSLSSGLVLIDKHIKCFNMCLSYELPRTLSAFVLVDRHSFDTLNHKCAVVCI